MQIGEQKKLNIKSVFQYIIKILEKENLIWNICLITESLTKNQLDGSTTKA